MAEAEDDDDDAEMRRGYYVRGMMPLGSLKQRQPCWAVPECAFRVVLEVSCGIYQVLLRN